MNFIRVEIISSNDVRISLHIWDPRILFENFHRDIRFVSGVIERNFKLGFVCSIFVFCVRFFRLLFLFFCPLCCLSFFDLRFLIIPFVSSYISFNPQYSSWNLCPLNLCTSLSLYVVSQIPPWYNWWIYFVAGDNAYYRW